MISVETDVKILEGMLIKKKAPNMIWKINEIESLCWDSRIKQVTFQYKDQYMVLKDAHESYKDHFAQYMDEFFDRIQKKIGAFYDYEAETK